ncbi:MAG: hypothetical protein MHMPM18_002377 [Marteilia pararefringens]
MSIQMLAYLNSNISESLDINFAEIDSEFDEDSNYNTFVSKLLDLGQKESLFSQDLYDACFCTVFTLLSIIGNQWPILKMHRTLTVDIIGAKKEILFLPAFKLLPHTFRGRRFQLRLFGQDISKEFDGHKLCSENLEIDVQACLFKGPLTSHLNFCPNAGLFIYPSWIECVRNIADETLFFITEYDWYSVERDVQFFSNFLFKSNYNSLCGKKQLDNNCRENHFIIKIEHRIK